MNDTGDGLNEAREQEPDIGQEWVDSYLRRRAEERVAQAERAAELNRASRFYRSPDPRDRGFDRLGLPLDPPVMEW